MINTCLLKNCFSRTSFYGFSITFPFAVFISYNMATIILELNSNYSIFFDKQRIKFASNGIIADKNTELIRVFIMRF